VRQLHGVADDQGTPGTEEQWQDVRDGALAGLVDDDQVEERGTEGGSAGWKGW
jgi:hypothetical protein